MDEHIRFLRTLIPHVLHMRTHQIDACGFTLLHRIRYQVANTKFHNSRITKVQDKQNHYVLEVLMFCFPSSITLSRL
jgi:hypothetical protein